MEFSFWFVLFGLLWLLKYVIIGFVVYRFGFLRGSKKK